MAVAKIGDLHLGSRKGCEDVRGFITDYIMNYFLPELEENQIKTVIQYGDFFDNRGVMYGKDKEWLREVFVPEIERQGITWHNVVGNHDITLADSNRINWVKQLNDLSPNHFKVYSEAAEVMIEDTLVLMLPWVNKENIEHSKYMLENTTAEYVAAHLELAGFPMYQGSVCEKGQLPLDLFDKFKRVDTGHFHCRSHDGKINYLGTPFHLTWQDYKDGENRGFYIDDFTEDGEVFIPNRPDQTMFMILDYDYSKIPLGERVKWLDPEWLCNELGLDKKIVKINVYNRDDQAHYNKFREAVNKCRLINHNYIDHTVTTSTEDFEVREDLVMADTIDIIKQDIQIAENIQRKQSVCDLAEIYFKSAVEKAGSI